MARQAMPLRWCMMPYTFEPTSTPGVLHQYEKNPTWRFPSLAGRYPRFSTDREIADENNLEWVTPWASAI
jgi:hypothetical protein